MKAIHNVILHSYLHKSAHVPHYPLMEFIAEETERLDKFLAERMRKHSRSRLAKWIEDGGVTVNGKEAKPSEKLRPGDVILVGRVPAKKAHDLEPADIPLEIAYEDEHLLVVNKPRGLAVHPASSLNEPSLVNALLGRQIQLSQMAGSFRPGIVHRLDKETTGLIIVAKTDAAHAKLAKDIETKTTERRYVAIGYGHCKRENFFIDAPLDRNPKNRLQMAILAEGRPALTHIKRLEILNEHTLFALKLETGRTHQIRVHLKSIHHPVLGDKLYSPEKIAEGAMQLHATFLRFIHPESAEVIELFSAPPEDFIYRDFVSVENVKNF